MTARRDQNSGYALVEALATLALSALVIGGLLALSGIFVRAGNRLAARVERLEVEPRAVESIARDIRQTARLRYAGGDRFIFLGLRDRIVIAKEQTQASGLRTPVAIAYQAAERGIVLRAEAPAQLEAMGLGDIAFPIPHRVSVGSVLIRFAYVEQKEGGGEIVSESWGRPTELPAAVRIDRVSAADGRLIGSLRVPLERTAEPGCAAPGKAFCSRAPEPQPGAGGAELLGTPAPSGAPTR